MQLNILNMNEEMAIEILHWRYEKPYDIYNNEYSEDAMNEIMDGSYFALKNEKRELIGFFCIGENAKVPPGNEFGAYTENLIDIGLGMNPNLVGQGNGFEFCTYIIKHIQEKFKNIPIRLTVATFNRRAIHLYEKLGFEPRIEFKTAKNQFITMIKSN